MVRANNRVAFQMAHLLSSFDMRRPIIQGAPIRDLAPLSLGRKLTGLLGPIAFKPTIARKLPADGRFVSLKQLGDLGLIVSHFYKGLDLISFNLAEMFVVHGQLRLAGLHP